MIFHSFSERAVTINDSLSNKKSWTVLSPLREWVKYHGDEVRSTFFTKIFQAFIYLKERLYSEVLRLKWILQSSFLMILRSVHELQICNLKNRGPLRTLRGLSSYLMDGLMIYICIYIFIFFCKNSLLIIFKIYCSQWFV